MVNLHKILGVITIITSVAPGWIVMSDENVQMAQIVLARMDKCCYNKETLVHPVKRLGDPAEGRMKNRQFVFPFFYSMIWGKGHRYRRCPLYVFVIMLSAQ